MERLPIFVGVLCLVPFLVTPVLPFTDFYAHVARYFVLAHIGSDPALAENYTAAWQLLPNLGMDILGTGLIALLPPLIAAKLIAVMTVIVPFAGILVLARVVHGTIPSICVFLAGIAVFSHILIWGFANFLLGAGLAMVGLAIWIALANTPRRQWMLTFLLGLSLFFVHGLAFALWGLLLGTVELALAIEARDLRPRALMRRVFRLVALAVVPALLFMQMPTAEVEGGVTQAFANLSAHAEAGRMWSEIANEIVQRIDNTLRVADSGWPIIDRLLGCLLWGGILAGLASGALGLDHKLRGAAILAVILAVVLPPNLFGVGYLDDRMPLVLLMLLAAGLCPTAPAIAKYVTMSAAGLFGLRLVLVTIGWAQDGQVYRDYLHQIERIEPGQMAVPVYFGDTGHRDSPLTSCKPLSFLLLLYHGTAVPTFSFASQQPLMLDGPLAAATKLKLRTDDAPLGTVTSENDRADILRAQQAAGFDTIVVCDPKPVSDAPPKGLRQLAAAGHWTIYRTTP
ncbi:hypothetical protein [Qingshengfaniella alkalisoli]|uniref:Glucosyltransferase GtrII-like protein n=1 Tax=Qingshengfaniella alkalisoli TaxID=2599296 RepID=A0A5B8IZ31_9RHOB|nr:hypothetical protein [Qingshengfaniella alkalisoli]QDY70964.1 hypothetical protein FPZ52_14815 [Qingshengfaniella alkalisoli]